MKWHHMNKNHYELKGYTFTSYRGTFEVNVKDLPRGCNMHVWIRCDYCLIKVRKKFQDYIKQNEEAVIKRDCCHKCRPLKIRESNLVVYGVESTNQLSETTQKRNETNKKDTEVKM